MAGYYQPPHKKILDKKRLTDFVASTNNYYGEQEEQNWSDRHLQKLNDLMGMADQKGIELVFILPPRIKMNMVSLFNQLPTNRTIDLCNPSLYPQFYSIENSRDIYHLNHKGATELTGVLSEKVLELAGQNGLLSRRTETY